MSDGIALSILPSDKGIARVRVEGLNGVKYEYLIRDIGELSEAGVKRYSRHILDSLGFDYPEELVDRLAGILRFYLDAKGL